jgi:hypothetical protein
VFSRSAGGGWNAPLVLLADKVLFAQVDEVGDGFGGEQSEVVDDVDLRNFGDVRIARK